MVSYYKIYERCQKANGEIVLYWKGTLLMHPSNCHNLAAIGFKVVNDTLYQWVYDGTIPHYYKSDRYRDRQDIFDNAVDGWLYALERRAYD
jgi:hypothetical protein